MERAGAGLTKIAALVLRGAPAEELPMLAWPLACGKTVAGRTRALKFAAGVLQVEVADRTWRSQLEQLAPRYLEMLNRLLPRAAEAAPKVERIQFVLPACETEPQGKAQPRQKRK
jgi:hypothetical protein